MPPSASPEPSPPHPGRRTAILQALLAAALFGLSTPAVKPLLGPGTEALTAGLLYLGMGAAMAVAFLARGAPSPRLERGEFGWLGVSVLLGGVVAPGLLYWGLARTPATVTALLSNAEVVFTTLIAHRLFREHYGRRLAAGLALIVAGTIVLGSGAAARTAAWPALAILAACLAWAIDNNATGRIAHADASFIGLAKGLVAGTCNTMIALSTGGTTVSRGAVLGTLLVGMLSFGLSFGLYVRALRKLGAARTSAYFATSPFAGAAAAVLVLGEPVTGRLLAATLLMAVGVWLYVTERPLAGAGER